MKFLNEILSYFALHPEIAGSAAAVSAFAALIALVLSLGQLRGAKLNREVARSQLDVTKEQAITTRNQADLSYRAIDQQKRAARIAEEVKLDNQAPDLAIIEYGPVKCAVSSDKKSNTSDYDWVFSEENDSVLPETFSITPGSDYRWWTLWVAGSLLLRNEGSRTVVLGPDLPCEWVGARRLNPGIPNIYCPQAMSSGSNGSTVTLWRICDVMRAICDVMRARRKTLRCLVLTDNAITC